MSDTADIQGQLVAQDTTRLLQRIFTGHIVGQPAMGYGPLNATVAANPAPTATQCAVTVDGFDPSGKATFTCNFESRWAGATPAGAPAVGTACVVCFPTNDTQGYGWVMGFKDWP